LLPLGGERPERDSVAGVELLVRSLSLYQKVYPVAHGATNPKATFAEIWSHGTCAGRSKFYVCI
jgi:hypothetical protein